MSASSSSWTPSTTVKAGRSRDMTDLDDRALAATIHGMRRAMAVNALGLPAVAV